MKRIARVEAHRPVIVEDRDQGGDPLMRKLDHVLAFRKVSRHDRSGGVAGIDHNDSAGLRCHVDDGPVAEDILDRTDLEIRELLRGSVDLGHEPDAIWTRLDVESGRALTQDNQRHE